MFSTKQELLAFQVRKTIIQWSTRGGCFTGASLSCTDLLVFLYTDFLKIDPANPKADDRDFLLLSKGHDVPALYGLLAELGFFEKKRLENHLKINDWLYWHPNTQIPGIEFHSGSLGQLPSVGIGIALDCKRKKSQQKVVVVLGDGELNEGSVWEALLVASAMKLDNLYWIIDRNQFQANMATESLIPLESLEDKFKAFGAEVVQVDGHNFEALRVGFQSFQIDNTKPKVCIAQTTRGKGLPSLENRSDRWFCNFDSSEIDQLLEELEAGKMSELHSETLIVR